MRILVDMDGVIADFDGEFLQRWRARHPDKLYFPLAERTSFYVKDQYPDELKPLVAEILLEPNFFRDMMPMEGAIESLREMQSLGIDVFICSSPLTTYQNCVREKYEWVENLLGADWVKKFILTKDKTLVRGEYLIDDKPIITGADTPTWEHILYDRPYNCNIERRRLTWKNWKDVLGLVV